MITKLKSYSDGGHGWLAVKRKMLVKLGIEHKISRYSYEKGQTVYLEEDCDAGLFLESCKNANIEVTITHKSTNRLSPIRSYDFYKTYAYSINDHVQIVKVGF